MGGGTAGDELLNVLLAGASKVVGSTLVVGDVKTDLLLEGIDTEPSEEVEHEEEGDHGGRDPGDDPEDTNELNKEEVGITGATAPGVEPSDVEVGSVGDGGTGRLGEETDGDAAPHAVGEVDGDGIDGIIDLELEEEGGETAVDPTGNDANEESTVGGDDGGTGGDTDEAGEAAVHGVGKIVLGLTGLHLAEESVSEHGGDGTGGGSHGGGDGAKTGNVSVSGGGDVKGRTGVESVPSEPEDEGTKDLKGDGVGGEGGGLGEGVAIGILETATTGTKDLGGDESGGTTGHVDDTTAGEVDHTDATERVVGEGGEETGRGPDGADDDGVDEAGEGKGVAKVGRHLATLGDGTGDDGGGGSGEGPLEEEGDIGVALSVVHDEEVGVANEGSVSAVGEGVTDGPEADGTTASIQKVLEHDVLDVLLTNGASTEHGETSLHKENASTLFIFGLVWLVGRQWRKKIRGEFMICRASKKCRRSYNLRQSSRREPANHSKYSEHIYFGFGWQAELTSSIIAGYTATKIKD